MRTRSFASRLVVLPFAFSALAACAQPTCFVGYKHIPGDTVWVKAHLVTTSILGVTGGSQAMTKMEQTVFQHQYTTAHSDSGATVVLVYDSIRLHYGGDSGSIDYNSTNPADSVASWTRMVYPLKALIDHPITMHITARGTVDSLSGLDGVIRDASVKLQRSAEITLLKEALGDERMRDLLQNSMANLPDTIMTVGTPLPLTRARMVGWTQFLDQMVTTLTGFEGDTARLIRVTYTHVASPTITYGGQRCVIDSTWGLGMQHIAYDTTHGVVIGSNENFSNYLRAGISGTNQSVIQTNELTAEVTLMRYAVRSAQKKERKRGK